MDRERSLAEARRVLVEAGWLVVYENFFGAQMEGAPACHAWVRGAHLERFPTPPRPRTAFGPAEAAGHGFRFAGQEQYQNTVTFSAEQLVDYLVTQTNVIAAVEGAGEPLADIRRWLMDEVEPLFGSWRLARGALPILGTDLVPAEGIGWPWLRHSTTLVGPDSPP